VADIPDTIVLRRHRDLQGRRNDVWFRRGLLALTAAIPILALFNVFGQRPGKPTVVSNSAANCHRASGHACMNAQHARTAPVRR